MKKNLIIWDWNGTLLNDVEACVNSMNNMLAKRSQTFLDQKVYKDIFTFPVKKYYEALDFDFNQESFEELSVEYIDLYKKLSFNSPLQAGAIETLDLFKANNYKQIIVSASEQLSLNKQVKERGIFYYFDAVIGLNNIYAKSKLDNAINYINNSSLDFEQIVLIGDTYHDYEVAESISAECILVQTGHQNLERFDLKGKALIVKDFLELKEIFNSKKSLIANGINVGNF
ncbi:MAG: HAD hydrolase-like protein [Bacteroidales bacterium]|jgi:phosphoglycolate phosphatase|nr:HAD hydrolase-like protein [Bacteroidales bacterium]